MQNVQEKLIKPNSDDSKVLKFGIIVVFAVFGLFFGWMAIAPLATSVVGSGKVSVDFNKKTLQHLDGGTIEQILIKEGDYVKKDDALIVLDGTQLRIAIEAANDQYLQAIAAIARLNAQKKKLTSIDFPEELEGYDEVKQDQQNILISRVSSIKEQQTITRQQMEQIEKHIKQQNENIESTRERLMSIQGELLEQQELVEKRLVDKQRLLDLQRQEIELKNEIKASELEIAKLEVKKMETKSTLDLKLKEFDNEVDAKLVEQKKLASEAKAKLEANSDKLAKTVIKAPASGYVNGLEIHTEGGVIPPGEPILDIVPKNSDMYVIAKVATVDIDKLQKGLNADIRFSAFNVQQTYVVEGVVTHISADSFKDKQSGEYYYEVKLELTPKGTEQLEKNKFFLLPGMPADVMISVGERTTLSYLVKPFTDMLAKSFNEE